jgi:hypothetical protein
MSKRITLKKARQLAPNHGWVCPLCGRVNAPTVPQCPCTTPREIPAIPAPYYPAYPATPWPYDSWPFPRYPGEVIITCGAFHPVASNSRQMGSK